MSEQPDKKVLKNELPHPLIKHVVVLMLENRGFDHLMGWLYDKDEMPPLLISRDDDTRGFIGLSTMSAGELQALANPMPDRGGPPDSKPIEIHKGARSPRTPEYNTGESFQHIMNQMWGVGLPKEAWLTTAARQKTLSERPPGPPPMNGYVLDYALEAKREAKRDLGRKELSEVLDTYTPEQVPVLSGLARNYAVSDEWFCSVPSQTNTNRAFSVTGTSRGLVNNSFYDPVTYNPWLGVAKFGEGIAHGDIEFWKGVKSGEIFTFKGKSHADALPVSTRSLFEVLEENNYTWKVFWQTPWPPWYMAGNTMWQYTRTMVPLLLNPQFDANFVRFDGSNPQSAFFEAARKGTLPAVSWIEPAWGGGPSWSGARAVGNDMHPVCDTTIAEDFVASVYLALSQSPKWDQTLLVITFDENGGTYDHVVPPPATPTGLDACPLPKPPIDRGDMDPQTRTQFGFDFKQYGVRVPTLLVSPCAPAGTLFRSQTGTPYDHASLIASILKMAGIDPANSVLGDRVAGAPTFDGVLQKPQARDAATTLSVPFLRSTAETLAYNIDYVFEYVGDVWWEEPGSVYLGASASGRANYYKYPTVVPDSGRALKFRLVPDGGGSDTGLILNMASVMIKTGEQPLTSTPYFSVNWENVDVFYDKGQGPASRWQIRLVGSRNPRDEVRVGDYVSFISQLPPPSAPRSPDPFQRLIPDPKNSGYLTTKAGEWALWRLSYAIGDDNV